MDSSPLAFDIENLEFSYESKPSAPLLRIPSFQVRQGERIFFYGPSGSGKSTLLSLLAGVLKVKAGRLQALSKFELSELSPRELDSFRGSHVGYIFQQFNLLPHLTVQDNILLPLWLSPEKRGRLEKLGLQADDELARLATELSIGALLDKYPGSLSVGQQQRAAAARAMMGRPEIVIADEPTSALDSDLRDDFMRLLLSEVAKAKSTLLFVSHDKALAAHFSRSQAISEWRNS